MRVKAILEKLWNKWILSEYERGQRQPKEKDEIPPTQNR